MWNPNAYRDTDYGLQADETFEPLDADGESFEPAPGEPFIQTVLGPIPPDAAEVALVHEQLQWRPGGLGQPQAIMGDLEAFFTASGRTVVAATPADAGRDAGALLTIAQHVPVHLVAATGWSASGEGPIDLAEVERRIEDDLAGLDGTAALPGMISATLDGAVADRTAALAVLRAAQGASGLPVTVWCEGAESVDAVLAAGLDDGPLIVGGPAVRGVGVAERVADAGAFSLFASLTGRLDEDNAVALRIAGVVRAGHRDRVLVSSGFTDPALLSGYGGRPGLGYLVEQFAIALLEQGLEAQDVRELFVHNAAHALSVRRAPSRAGERGAQP